MSENTSENYNVEEYEALLTTLATAVRDMMARTKTSRPTLAKKIGKDIEWLNKFLNGFNEDVCADDIQAMASAMKFKTDIHLNERKPGSGPAYEVRNDTTYNVTEATEALEIVEEDE
jgi:hypothetical protein